jgi:hypothetical protein
MSSELEADSRIRLEGAVERVETALHRVQRVAAALKPDAWWVELAFHQEDADALEADAGRLQTDLSRVKGAGPFETLIGSYEAARASLERRITELDGVAGSPWNEALQRLCSRAHSIAPAPRADEVSLWEDRAPRRLSASIVIAATISCLAMAAAARSVALVVIGGVVGLAGAVLLLRRPKVQAQLFADRLVVELPPPRAEFPLAQASVTLDPVDETLTFTRQDASTSVPASDELLALVELARAGLLVSASPRAREDALVFPARDESGADGALLLTREVVLFVPHETASDVATTLTGRAPPRRIPADALLLALRWLPAFRLDLAVEPLHGWHGLRYWPSSAVSWRGEVRTRSPKSSEPLDTIAGSVAVWRDAQFLDLTVTLRDADALKRRVRVEG